MHMNSDFRSRIVTAGNLCLVTSPVFQSIRDNVFRSSVVCATAQADQPYIVVRINDQQALFGAVYLGMLTAFFARPGAGDACPCSRWYIPGIADSEATASAKARRRGGVVPGNEPADLNGAVLC